MPESNPTQYLDTYSKILGIRQAQQTYQTGKALQEQAIAQSETQKAEAWKAHQLQGEQQYLVGNLPKIISDPDAYDENHVLKADYVVNKYVIPGMPLSGQEMAQHFYDTQKAGIAVNQEALKLNSETREAVYTALGGAAMSPEFGKISRASDYADFIDNVKGQLPKQAQATVDAVLRSVPAPKEWNAETVKNLQNDLETLARAALPPSEQAGPGGLATPQNAEQNAGNVINAGTRAPAIHGGGFTPKTTTTVGLGPQVISSPVPGTAPAVLSNGRLSPLGGGAGTGGGVSPAGGRVGGGKAAPAGPDQLPQFHMAPGQAAAVSAATEGISSRVQQAQTAANNTVQAQDALTRALSIMQQGGPATGQGFDTKRWLLNATAALGGTTDAAADENTLVKNLARYEATRATQAGLGGTDAARELAHNGSPQTAIDKNALIGIIRQSLATEQAIAMYANVQQKSSSNPTAMQTNESDFRKIPNLIQALEYKMMRSAKEADEFLKKNGLSKADLKKSFAMINEFSAR